MASGTEQAMIHELARRIDALDGWSARSHPFALAADLDAIRRLAVANGFGAVPPVIHAIAAALGRGESGPAVSNGLGLLRDAVRCGRDARGGAVFAAACHLRGAG